MTVINHLSLIKQQIVRQRALEAAQLVTLQAYRGVVASDPQEGASGAPSPSKAALNPGSLG
jgi:hypothetical protein